MAFNGVSPGQLLNYSITPAAQPPPGVLADFERPSPLVTATIIVITILFFFTTALVALRIYTRHFFLKQLWWDDCMSLMTPAHVGRYAHLKQICQSKLG